MKSGQSWIHTVLVGFAGARFVNKQWKRLGTVTPQKSNITSTRLQQNGSSVLEWPSGIVQNSKTSNSLAGSCTRHHKTYRLSFTPKRIRSPVRHKSIGWGFTAAPWKVVLAGEERILHNFTLDGLLFQEFNDFPEQS